MSIYIKYLIVHTKISTFYQSLTEIKVVKYENFKYRLVAQFLLKYLEIIAIRKR